MNTYNLVMRGFDVTELRKLAHKYLDDLSWEEIESLDKLSLISNLSNLASQNKKLSQEMRKSSISMKPSFFLMVLNPQGIITIPTRKAKELINKLITGPDLGLHAHKEVAPYKEFRVEEVVENSSGLIELRFTWQRAIWYWEPMNVSLEHIFELQFGFVVLNIHARKAIIACHTEHERKYIADAICRVYPIKLTPLVLTQPILNEIGSFDHVRRAGYFIPDADSTIPSNITYADEKLPIKKIARQEEINPRSIRKYSYYLIPLGSIVEQGVGATSDSGKLWIPRQLPLDTIRDYAVELLEKIGRTLDRLTSKKEYSTVLKSLGVYNLPKLSSIKNVYLRTQIFYLIEELVNMLLRDEKTRPYTLPLELVEEGIPSLFNYPRFQITDPETNDVGWWKNPDGTSNFVMISIKNGEAVLSGHPGKEAVNCAEIQHPITNNLISIENPLDNLQLLPSPLLHEILLEAILHISNQIKELRNVVALPFQIFNNQIILDIERATNIASKANIGTVIALSDIREFRQIALKQVSETNRKECEVNLVKLGEKCVNMNDDLCRACIDDTKYLCLRSLVGRSMEQTYLLAHKGIELSDVQGKLSIGDDGISVWGFAKLSQGNGSLTARNKNGAILLSQVLGQIDKTTFDTVMIISPSVINEDLLERLQLICGIFGKKLLILDKFSLCKFLAYFEEQANFDNLDVGEIYKNSRNLLKAK